MRSILKGLPGSHSLPGSWYSSAHHRAGHSIGDSHTMSPALVQPRPCSAVQSPSSLPAASSRIPPLPGSCEQCPAGAGACSRGDGQLPASSPACCHPPHLELHHSVPVLTCLNKMGQLDDFGGLEPLLYPLLPLFCGSGGALLSSLNDSHRHLGPR